MKQAPGLLTAVETLMREVGVYQLSRFRSQTLGRGDEKQAREFVSEVDLNSEQQLIAGLSTLLPEAGFYGEETGKQGDQDLVWIIDPLDGTTNYLSGLDQFSISVALVEQGKPILGGVYRPASGDIFSASASSSFTHNGNVPASIEPNQTLAQSLLGSGFPYRSPDLADAFFPAAQDVLYRCRGLRRFGSAALDLSYLASGYIQAFWESDLQPYDIAAALVFLEQRGCVVTNQFGEPYDMFRDRVLVGGWPGVHAELLPVLAKYYR